MQEEIASEKRLSVIVDESINILDEFLVVESSRISGSVNVAGAKNAVLAIMASLILTDGKSILTNVPASHDVFQMIIVLQKLGAKVFFDQHAHCLEIDTSSINLYTVEPSVMKKMRASILVMGPLLARLSRADIALPGGCSLGKRPIDFHIKNFEKMGISFVVEGDFLYAKVDKFKPQRVVLEYPSVGATENILMLACGIVGKTQIVNASLEPEVLDLIAVLKKMGAHISIQMSATIEIEGMSELKSVSHHVLFDRLEAGSLLLAAAITGGDVYLPNINSQYLDVFLLKLQEMGHKIVIDQNGILLSATKYPKAVSFTTGPYPGFPTDLQPGMLVLQCLAEGVSIIHETVYENRLMHVRELQKMGAQIEVKGDRAFITGIEELFGTHVIASDIRASCALVLAGLVAHGQTVISGVHHWRRGYEFLEKKIHILGGHITLKTAA